MARASVGLAVVGSGRTVLAPGEERQGDEQRLDGGVSAPRAGSHRDRGTSRRSSGVRIGATSWAWPPAGYADSPGSNA